MRSTRVRAVYDDFCIPGHPRMIVGAAAVSPPRMRLRHDARMGFDAPLAELLACPSCGTRLTGAGCLACRVDFPSIGGIPWLMPEPRLALTEWRGRLHHLLTHYSAEARASAPASTIPAITPMTRTRIERVAAALDDQAARIRELMHPSASPAATKRRRCTPHSAPNCPSTRGSRRTIPTCIATGAGATRRIAPASRRSSRACPHPARRARVLVLGAGACRLAYDLHQLLRPSLTVALDFNPFFLLAAARILAGPPLELYEFPIAPRSIEDHAQLRVHAAPEAAGAGFRAGTGRRLGAAVSARASSTWC